jgi:hypothetical protein
MTIWALSKPEIFLQWAGPLRDSQGRLCFIVFFICRADNIKAKHTNKVTYSI